MHLSSFHYFPLAWPFILGLLLILVIVVALIELRVLAFAYERMGVPPRYVLLILLVSLLGSQVNIPVLELPPEDVQSDQIVKKNGVHYVVPKVEHWNRTIVAVNVGGALIPTLLSIYLMIRNRLFLIALVGIGIVTVAVHFMAEPVKGVGITVPIFIPPVIAAVTAMVLARRKAPPMAYISGTLGTLLGADVLNLGNIQGLGAPIASIGGAGTFDSVFLTGIIAVLLSPAAVPDERERKLAEEEARRRHFERIEDEE